MPTAAIATGRFVDSGADVAIAPPHAMKAAKVVSRRKKLVRRVEKDFSQCIRLSMQAFFLSLNLWMGVQFYLWVRWAETGGRTASVSRPAGVEGWLPIEGMMQFKYVFTTWQLPRLHPAAFFLFFAFALISLLFRKSFCGWLCPVGTISEYLWKIGRRIFRRNFQLPGWLDLPLRSLKYLLLGFFVYAVAMMSAAEISDFIASPYGLVVDVRMLNFFRFAGLTTLYVVGGLVVVSVFVQNFWCRYLCPYGALMGLIAMFSPLRIRRNETACIDCAKCAKACPSALPVDQLIQIRSAECMGCLECVAVCPAEGALALNLVGPSKLRRGLAAWQLATGMAIVFCGLLGYAKLGDHWQTPLRPELFLRLVPAASEQHHPMIGDAGR
ncbi:MAG TPA: 4Fe-4S binding protein [Candidatus Sulfotelmatobacter sp.]|nr:4Fe-4S binding protein [Candidatus Sulfotelmatobacter sp.]